MINPDGTTESYDQGRYAKDNKGSRQIRSRGLCPFPSELIAALFEIIPEPPIVKVVAQAYSSILYLKPNITTFHTTLDWLQSSLSLMECREHETIYLKVPLRTWRNWEAIAALTRPLRRGQVCVQLPPLPVSIPLRDVPPPLRRR